MDFTPIPVLNLLSILHLALLKRACLTCLQYDRTKIHNHQNLNIKCNLSSSRCVFQIFQNTKKICFPMFLIVNLVRFPIFTNSERCVFQYLQTKKGAFSNVLLLSIWCVFRYLQTQKRCVFQCLLLLIWCVFQYLQTQKRCVFHN